MLKALALSIALISSAFAGEILINTVNRSEVGVYDTFETTFFNLNEEALVSVKFFREARTCLPTSDRQDICIPDRDTAGDIASKVEGLNLIENKYIYAAPEGDIVCATKKRGFFGQVKTVLTGRCRVNVKRSGRELKLFFVTK